MSQKAFSIAFCFTVFVCLSGVAFADVPVAQYNALWRFYNDTNGASWSDRTWVPSNSPCTYTEVLCNDDGSSIVGINFNEAEIIGTLPNYLFSALPDLKLFVAYSPRITGTLPNLIFDTVTKLDLNLAGISGTIPSTLEAATEMQYLDLDFTHLTGSLPDITRLNKLEYLEMSSRVMSNNVPNVCASAATLKSFSMHRIHGTFPACFSETPFPALESLTLSGPISGTLPIPMFSVNNFTYVSLVDTDVTGTVPELFALNLETFSIRGSRGLHGPLPESLCGAVKLWSLDISGTDFKGASFPSNCIRPTYRYFNVSRANLAGPIPDTLESLCTAPYTAPKRQVDLRGNKFDRVCLRVQMQL